MASADSLCFFMIVLGLAIVACVDAVNTRYQHRESTHFKTSCSSGKYYDVNSKECRNCSSCPMNEIIRRPCHKHRDTVCGPFTEFDRFNQASDQGGEKPSEKPSKNSISNNHIHGKFHSDEKLNPKHNGRRVHDDVYETIPNQEKRPEMNQSPGLASVTTEVDEQWRLLALVLIGVLSVVSMLLVIFVFIACHMLKKRRLLQKTVVCSSDTQASGHYFRPPVFTGDRFNPTDHMHALLHGEVEQGKPPQRKQNVYQVYGELPSCSRNGQDIPGNEEEEVVEDSAESLVPNSGDQSSGYSSVQSFPEVVPGGFTDYVYFKTPSKHSAGQA